MRERGVSFLILCLLWFAWIAVAEAATLRDLAVYEDREGGETIASIHAGDPGRFKPLPADHLSAGYSRSVHWLRFTIEAGPGEWWLDLLPPYLDDLRLYEPIAGKPGAFREHRAGDTLPFPAREVDYRGFVFKLHFDQAGARTVYLRVQTTSTHIVLPRISAPDELFAINALEVGVLMAVLAVMLTVILFNLNAWFWLRDSLSLWFIAVIAALTLNTCGSVGFLQQYFFPEQPAASYYGIGIGAISGIAFANAFYRRLYGIGRDQPFPYWLFQGCFWLGMVSLLSLPLGYYSTAITVLMATVPLVVFVSTWLAWRLWRRGEPGGSMMFVASLITMLSMLFFIAAAQGLLASEYSRLHGYQMAAVGIIIPLQIAIGRRYRGLREAQLRAERDAHQEREQRLRQGQFIAMLAHELRTALSVLRLAFGTQPMSDKATASARRAMDGMSDVIERSLQAEKLTDGVLRIERAPCDVSAMLQAVVSDSAAPQRLRLDLPALPLSLDTDGKLLRVILSNLVDNALKYGDDQKPVEISMAEENGGVIIRVANAVGRAGQPDPGQVFDKYYRSPQARACTGSGLGLYIAESLARLLGGSLRLLPDAEQVVFELRL